MPRRLPDPGPPVAEWDQIERDEQEERLGDLPVGTRLHPKVNVRGAITRRNPELRAMRAEHMLLRRAAGLKIKEIAQEFQLAPDTVTDELKWARRRGIMDRAQHYLVDRLIPKALAGMEVALDHGNYEAARDLLFGIGLLQKSVNGTVQHTLGPPGESFDQWRMTRIKRPDGSSATIVETAPTLPPPPGAEILQLEAPAVRVLDEAADTDAAVDAVAVEADGPTTDH